MAKPRVFISSTFFDLRVVRADLERFIKEMGYEPVLFERGHVPYAKDDALEDNCYREISSCDVLIAIIGGKYGTQSKDQKHSITERELKTAIQLGKQIYVFVERSVHAEFRTYQANKEVSGFRPTSVDDVKVFSVVEEIYGLPVGNPIEPFEVSDDITRFLREQLAGLFQRLLQESARQKEVNIIESLDETATTLKQLVTYLTEERSKGEGAIKDILLSSHPAFSAIKKAARVQYRVVFHNLKELEALLTARGFRKDNVEQRKGFVDWDNQTQKYGLRFAESIFDKQGKLKIITPDEWKDEWVDDYSLDDPENKDDDDEIPF